MIFKNSNEKGEKKREPASAEEEPPEEHAPAGKPPFMGDWQKGAPPETQPGDEESRSHLEPRKNEKEVSTPKGTVFIENYCPPEKLQGLEVDEGICMFSRHDPSRQLKSLIDVSGSEGGNIIAGTRRKTLAGYIGVHHPSERERWGKPDYPWLFELGAIEVSRNYRKMGLAESMLEVAFSDPFYDDKIVLTTGFTWHWDLEKTGMDKMQYRALGIELLGRYGFMEMATDEPNVAMDSANLFLVRLGKDASFSRYQKFASLLFANEWEAMLRGF